MTCSLQHHTRGLWALLALVLFVSACAGDSDRSAATGSDDSAADADAGDADAIEPADAPTEEAPESERLGRTSDAETDGSGTFLNTTSAQEGGDDGEAAPDGGGSGLALPTDLTSLVAGRQIIYTATIDIEVENVEDATIAAANAIVLECRCGLVFGQDTTTDPVTRTVLTFKVLPASFDEAMAALAGVGEVQSQTISTDDVTERVVDLESRITTAAASVERVRLLLDDAPDLNLIRDLEQQLLDRETLLEQLRGQLKTVRDQVSLATITLTIVERSVSDIDADIEVVAWLGVNEDDACPGLSELAIEADDDAVLCIEVRNTADDVLTEIDIEVPTFRIRVDDLTVRSGSLDALEPGDALTAVVVLDAEDGFIRRQDVSSGTHIEVMASAVPAGDADALVVAADRVFLSADVDEPLPGFGDSFETGWGALITVFSIVLIGVGTALPFTPFIAVLLFLALRRRRRSSGEAWADDHDDVSAE